jgi:hypothetical protein
MMLFIGASWWDQKMAHQTHKSLPEPGDYRPEVGVAP